MDTHVLAPTPATAGAGSVAGSDSSSDADSLAGFEEYLDRRNTEKEQQAAEAETAADPDCLP